MASDETRSERREPAVEVEPADGAGGARSTFFLKFSILAILAGGVMAAHYMTRTTGRQMVLHTIYERVLYIPIILAAFWFGWRGGLICAVTIAVAYFPHIVHDWGGRLFDLNLNRTLEALMYVIVGVITGSLIDRLRWVNERLSRQSAQLERAMTELTDKTRAIFEAEEQLRRADRLRALGELTTGLAHEIRNPLASIRGSAEILGDAESEAGQRRECSRILVEETERLDKVLKNFLDYARTQKDEATGHAELRPPLDRLLKLLDKQMQSAGIRATVDLQPALPPLRIPETMLQQILLNLMLNAVQAMTGGGELRVEARREPADRSVRITIGDTGPGIPASIRGRVFDPFFTTKAAGTGLGLSIVYKLVANHQGDVFIDEAYERGARMVVRLPSME